MQIIVIISWKSNHPDNHKYLKKEKRVFSAPEEVSIPHTEFTFFLFYFSHLRISYTFMPFAKNCFGLLSLFSGLTICLCLICFQRCYFFFTLLQVSLQNINVCSDRCNLCIQWSERLLRLCNLETISFLEVGLWCNLYDFHCLLF